MFVHSQYTHASFPKCQYQTKKKSRISKMKNIAHIRTFMHLHHFLQDLFWDPLDAVMISTLVFLKKIIWDPPYTMKVFTSLKK